MRRDSDGDVGGDETIDGNSVGVDGDVGFVLFADEAEGHLVCQRIDDSPK